MISQVVLSFGIPFALVPLVLVTRRADIMGALVNRRVTTAVAAGIAALIIALNAYLLLALVRRRPAAAAGRPMPESGGPDAA